MNKRFFILGLMVSAIFLVGLVSALTIPANVGVTMNQTYSTATIYTNPSNDYITVPFNESGYYGNVSFFTSNLLNAINFTATVNDGSSYPLFTNVSVDSGLAVNITSNFGGVVTDMPNEPVNSILPTLHSINSTIFSSLNQITPSYLTSLASGSSVGMQPIQGTATITKAGNVYTVDYTKGYGDVSSDYSSQIQSVIGTMFNQEFNLESQISSILPFVNSSYLGLNSDSGYNIVVGLSALPALNNGNYIIPVTVSSDGNSATVNVNLVLQGFTTYVPMNTSVSQVVGPLVGTPVSSVDLLDSSFLLSLPSQLPSNVQPLNLINITTVGSADGLGTITFYVPTSSVPQGSQVVLYFWNESTLSWDSSGISLSSNNTVGNGYVYVFQVPHFSLFVVGVMTPSSTVTPVVSATPTVNSGYPYSGPGYVPSSAVAPLNSQSVNSNAAASPSNTNPTNLNNPSGITGGVIGALTSPGGITFLVLFIVGAGAILIVVVKRKMSKKVVADKKKK
ncbi:MAG: hypothetical protein WAU65_03220 [Candidatus Nanoarchaeia archaeon]